MELLGTWRSLYSLRYSPITLVQTAFSAGTIFLLVAVQAATGLRVAQESLKHSLSQAQLCVQYLLEIGKSWQCATNIAEILRNLLQEQLKPLLDRRAIPQAGQLEFTTPGPSSASSSSTSAGTFSLKLPSHRRQHSTSRKRDRSRSSASSDSPAPAPIQTQHGHMQPQPPPVLQLPPGPSPTNMNFDERWGSFDYNSNTSTSGPLSASSSNDGMQFSYLPALNMESSPGYLAMLGGEPLSNAPFLPTFTKMDSNTPGLETSYQALPLSNGPAAVPIPDSEFAILEQFWNQHFG